MKKEYDVIVIGAGSGLTISSYAAEKGLKVALIEPSKFGGTCLNKGCIPSKMLIHTADIIQEIQNSQKLGINATAKPNWNKIVQRVTKFINNEAQKIEKGNKQTKNITLYTQPAKFIESKTIQTGNNIITAKKIFICAGTRPNIPQIKGLNKVPHITSDEALSLTKQPKKLIIIGGGYIGCELAHYFGSPGTKVTIIQKGNILMANEDMEIAKTFTKIYQKKYDVILNAETNEITKKGKQTQIKITTNGKKKTITGDVLLIATGRKPNTDKLNVSEAGIQTDKRGYIIADDYLETSVPGIWAIGDIIGRYQFKHAANMEADYAILNAFGKKQKADYTAMPHAAFTNPQVASVGQTEEELKQQQKKYLVGKYKYNKTGYGKAIEDNDGYVKILIDKKTQQILGCHIIGSHASILIHEVILAMKNKITATQLVLTVHVHPSLSEVIQRATENAIEQL